MSELRMASFGQGFVQTQVLSENNSVKYKLEFTAGVPFSTPSASFITFQDAQIGIQQDGVGINTREFNPTTNKLGEFKSFVLTEKDSDPGNQAFLTYMRGLTGTNLILITTGHRLFSSDVVDAQFKAMHSVMWPVKGITSRFPCFYSGIYSIVDKAIVAENLKCSEGYAEAKDTRPIITCIYDKPADIGATGFPRRAIEDMTTYPINATTLNKRYPNQNEQISPLSPYGLSPGDKAMFSLSLKGDASLGPSGQSLRANIRWFRGTSYLSGTTVETAPSDLGHWIAFERYVTVPADADGFTVIVSRNPEIASSTATGEVKSMLLCRVSRAMEAMNEPASFGVYGIRANMLSSVDVNENTLLVLPDTKDDKSGNIYSADFREYQD